MNVFHVTVGSFMQMFNQWTEILDIWCFRPFNVYKEAESVPKSWKTSVFFWGIGGSGKNVDTCESEMSVPFWFFAKAFRDQILITFPW